MNPDIAVSLVSKGLELALVISAPVLIAGLAVGLLVSIFQAVTQIQEMTLSFIPKIIVMVVLIGVTFPWMLSTLMEYTVALIMEHFRPENALPTAEQAAAAQAQAQFFALSDAGAGVSPDFKTAKVQS